jgi:hypothetical protein
MSKTTAPLGRDALCDRAQAALGAVPIAEWTLSELRAFVNLLEAIVEARRPADKAGNLVYLSGRR